MKKQNYMALTESLNKFRMEHQSKTYTREELIEILCGLGFNRGTAGMVIAKFIHSEKMGNSKLYSFDGNPIHHKGIEAIYRKFATYGSKKTPVEKPVEKPVDNFKEVKEVNDAIHLLLSKGYKVSRPLGLDTKQLLADHPELAQKYMRYANI